jgi:hypothetical protein
MKSGVPKPHRRTKTHLSLNTAGEGAKGHTTPVPAVIGRWGNLEVNLSLGLSPDVHAKRRRCAQHRLCWADPLRCARAVRSK